jgi:hypothetical protein
MNVERDAARDHLEVRVRVVALREVPDRLAARGDLAAFNVVEG